MKRALTIIALFASLTSFRALAISYTTYGNQASFLSGAGGAAGLAFEDFEGLGGNQYNTLSATTLGIPSGVIFHSTGGNPSDLFVAPAGFAGNPAILSDSLFANFFGTPLIVDFAPGVTAVGSFVLSYPSQATLSVTLMDDLGALTTYNVNPPTGRGYFGITVTGGEITQIQYGPSSGYTAGIDDLYFGQVTSGVPEVGSTLMLLGTVFGALASFKSRRC